MVPEYEQQVHYISLACLSIRIISIFFVNSFRAQFQEQALVFPLCYSYCMLSLCITACVSYNVYSKFCAAKYEVEKEKKVIPQIGKFVRILRKKYTFLAGRFKIGDFYPNIRVIRDIPCYCNDIIDRVSASLKLMMDDANIRCT